MTTVKLPSFDKLYQRAIKIPGYFRKARRWSQRAAGVADEFVQSLKMFGRFEVVAVGSPGGVNDAARF